MLHYYKPVKRNKHGLGVMAVVSGHMLSAAVKKRLLQTAQKSYEWFVHSAYYQLLASAFQVLTTQ